MINSLKKGVKNFISSINANIDECNNDNIEGYVSKIELKENDKITTIYVVIPNEKLKYISNFYFAEDEYDAKDLTNEIANQIVGNSKMILNENNKNYTLSTPQFLGKFNNNIEYDKKLGFKFNNDKCFFILIKE